MQERATDLTAVAAAAAALETTYAELRLWCGTPKATPFPVWPILQPLTGYSPQGGGWRRDDAKVASRWTIR